MFPMHRVWIGRKFLVHEKLEVIPIGLLFCTPRLSSRIPPQTHWLSQTTPGLQTSRQVQSPEGMMKLGGY